MSKNLNYYQDRTFDLSVRRCGVYIHHR